ncbi:threonine synthase [Candidatus Kaiserbacteria bacterium RIFCSPHIGHO2_12_FULL_53_13]|uniref:Threonine synthase n=1 Tax=Candidatus Kaiserbacteria bacterium RIFCSPHIGHO2_12_FULL_53_13 TaxID=1798502 RepID=A0A1F6EA95_9BACT|nr:MAG: threonine synthase [Candidatus Kaiserbacteria bacterium RIFCSPHIGHO2_12_FULL_53_13]OGG74502.1 MAG: threonine synthase [Candidatus Kaiserbacteria bacterium RIFCSPLOWO2_01_FULL_52_36]
MKMISTRDGSRTARSYTDVLLAGLAPDGGLYVPSEYPKFPLEDLKKLKGLPYRDIAFAVKKKLVDGDIPDEDLRKLIDKAYSEAAFGAVPYGNIVPLMKVEDNFYVQQLSLGPTAAFKDMALQQLGQEMNYELKKRNEHLTILGATSGDTGSAAEAAFKGLDNVVLFMLSPEEGMSPFQKAQMGALSGSNIFNVSVRGRFDDCQDLVKELKQEEEFSKLGAVNSINWGRISSQVPYFFSGYLQAAAHVGDEVDFVVPTGNFGNILSGYIAKRMGVPIRRLIVATNENDVMDKLFKTGVYELTPTHVTSSPSMDISKASNYERLAFDLFDGDAGKVKKYMDEFEKNKKVDLRDYGIGLERLKELGFMSGNGAHAKRLRAIQEVNKKGGFVIDPHTADAVAVGWQYKDKSEDVPMVCMGTALPVKFEDTTKEALGYIPERPKRFLDLEGSLKDGAFYTIDADAEQLKEYIRGNMRIA